MPCTFTSARPSITSRHALFGKLVPALQLGELREVGSSEGEELGQRAVALALDAMAGGAVGAEVALAEFEADALADQPRAGAAGRRATACALASMSRRPQARHEKLFPLHRPASDVAGQDSRYSSPHVALTSVN